MLYDINGNSINVSKLAGKRITLIGDSITEKNGRASKNWAMYLADMTGCIVQNLGISGTGFTRGSKYIDRISSIRNPDFIGVALSFNDLSSSVGLPVGTASDTGTESLAGYANAFFDALINAYPSTAIVCYVQNPWNDYHAGIELSDSFVRTIKEICHSKGIGFDDGMYYGSVLKPWILANREVYFKGDVSTSGYYNTVDTDHPNSKGHEVIAKHLIPVFETYTNIANSGNDTMVSVSNLLTSGEVIATLTIDGAEKQIRAGDSAEQKANKTTVLDDAHNNDALYPSAKAVKTYVDTIASMIGDLIGSGSGGSEPEMIRTNNKLDVSKYREGYGISIVSASNCLTNIDSCFSANSSRVAFTEPIEIEPNKVYKLCKENIDEGGPWYVPGQYYGLYAEDGSYITRIEGGYGFGFSGTTFRSYRSYTFEPYTDTELSKVPKYVLVSVTTDTFPKTKQLRVVDDPTTAITDYVPFEIPNETGGSGGSGNIGNIASQLSALSAKVDALTHNDLRVLFVSDLHYGNPQGMDAGHTQRERMQLMIDTIKSEDQKKKLSAVFVLGDFERGYGKGAAEYIQKHYFSQLGIPVYALPGDHDYYTSAEWEAVFGYGREFEVDLGDYRFIAVDVYKNTIGQMTGNATVLPTLDEANQTARINAAKAAGKKPILMCHLDRGLIEDGYTTSTWRSFMRANCKAVFRAHTHKTTIDNNGYSSLMFYTVGNFSYPFAGDWNNLNDADGNPVNRWGMRELVEAGNDLITNMVYPAQDLTINDVKTYYDYEIGTKNTV